MQRVKQSSKNQAYVKITKWQLKKLYKIWGWGDGGELNSLCNKRKA